MIKKINVFSRSMFWFLLIAIVWFIAYLINNAFPSLLTMLLSVIVYLTLSQICIERILRVLWDYIGKVREPQRLTATLGFVDRLIYALFFILNQYSFIGVYFGIKVATRLISNLGKRSDDGSDFFKDEGERKNLYLLGNILSCLLGIGMGIFIKQAYNSR